MKTSWLNGAFCFGGALLLAAVFGVGGCSSLPDEEVYPVDITIGEIEANMQKALDPDGRYAKAKSYVQRQITQEIRWLEENADEMLTDVKFVSPDKLMMVNIVDNAPQSGIIINGDRGWQIDYANKRSNELGESQMKLVRTLTLIANPGSRLSKVFDDIKITGCRVGDEDFYKLVCTVDDSNPNLPSLDMVNVSFGTPRVVALAGLSTVPGRQKLVEDHPLRTSRGSADSGRNRDRGQRPEEPGFGGRLQARCADSAHRLLSAGLPVGSDGGAGAKVPAFVCRPVSNMG